MMYSYKIRSKNTLLNPLSRGELTNRTFISQSPPFKWDVDNQKDKNHFIDNEFQEGFVR